MDSGSDTVRAPNRLVRVLAVAGIIGAIAAGNFISSVTIDLEPSKKGPKFPVPFPVKPIQATSWLNTGGKPITWADLRGKVVLLEFWRFECPSCMKAMPVMKRWEKNLAPLGLEILTVHSPAALSENENDLGKLKTFIRENQITVPVALDDSRATMLDYDTIEYPTFYLVDQKGTVVDAIAGTHVATEVARFEAKMKSLLQKAPEKL